MPKNIILRNIQDRVFSSPCPLLGHS